MVPRMDDELEPVIGSWDALFDAIELLEKSGLTFVLSVAMDGSRMCRTRTNATTVDRFEWMRERCAENMALIREKLDD